MVRLPAGCAATVLFAVGALAASCGNEAPGADRSERTAADVLTGTGSHLDDQSTLDDLLRSDGLKVDRSVALPGTDAIAFVVEVPGQSAVDAWKSLRALVPTTGRYPVIVGGPVDFGGDISTEFGQTLASGGYLVEDAGLTVESVLSDAVALDIDNWLTARAEYLDIDDVDLHATSPLPAYDFDKDQYTTGVDIVSGEPLRVVEIVLLPTRHGWEAPAYLMWGGWNDAPLPHELAAVFQRWSVAHGAEVVAMTGDVIEMSVMSPPTDDLGAIDVAREHFLIAPDNVWQGTGDLDVLAAAVLNAPVWFFWWD